jgi:hypothetical protein
MIVNTVINIYGTIKKLIDFLNEPTKEGFELRTISENEIVYLPLFELGYDFNNGESLELHACKTCSTRGVHTTPLKDFFFCNWCHKLIHVSMLKPVKFSEGKYIDA